MFKKKDARRDGKSFMSDLLINSVYIIAAVLFIFGLKLLVVAGHRRARQPAVRRRHADRGGGHPARTRSSTISGSPSAIVIGSVIGAVAAQRVQ